MKRLLFFLLSPLLIFTITTARASDLPASFDLRDIDGRSYIGAVRDQASCGSCYSFGALAAAESTWNRANDLYDSRTINLSESFIVWSLSPLYDGFDGCNGSSYDYEELTGLTEYGVPLETDFPYTTTDPGDDLHWDADRYVFRDWYRTPPNDIETIKRILSEVGAVDAAVYVDDDFQAYSDGIFENDNTTLDYYVPYYSTTNHAISLVGWNDDPGDGGMGYWILRNSWSDAWGEDGYMRIRYTSAQAAMEGTYLMTTSWNGESIDLSIENDITATTWSSGGTLNAHGVDLWGGAASSVTNQAAILAEARAENELATARGVYLWGGPDGSVINGDRITAQAQSQNNQATAYGICMQGGMVQNAGLLQSEAVSQGEQAMAFGVWAANGGNAVEISNSGEMQAQARDSDTNAAYGIWADSRSLATVTNSGQISASADDYAVGVLLTGGPACLENSGTIQAAAEPSTGWGVGVSTTGPGVILNSGTISGTQYSIYAENDTLLTLGTGSDLIGTVVLVGAADRLLLTGSGSEDDIFQDVEQLTMSGGDWTLSGDSDFDTITVNQGRLGIDGDIGGNTTILSNGILGGNGTLTGNTSNSGTAAPGHSIGHLTIDGDYTQQADGILEIETGNNTADQLTVTGTANLAGTLRVLPDGYADDGNYTFLDAGTINGMFDRIQSAAILQVEIDDSTPDTLGMAVTRNTYTSLATVHNLELAENLDDVRAGAADDFSQLLGRLDRALTIRGLNDNLAQLTPRIHGLATTLALEDSQARLHTLRQRLGQGVPIAIEGQTPAAKTTFWLEIPGHQTRYGSDGAYFGARKDSYGVIFGAERTTPAGLQLGLSGAWTQSRYESDQSADEGQSDSLEGYLYGQWRRRPIPGGLQIGAALGAGTTKLEADRSIAFSDRTARSSHNGRTYSAFLQGGYDWTPGNWVLGPSLGISWVNLHENGFRESGADSADLDIRSRNSDSLQSFLGARFVRPAQWAETLVEPEFRVEWHHEFSPDTQDLEARLSGGSDYFTTPARDLAEDSLFLGVGLKARWSESFSGALNYGCKLQDLDGNTDHALRLQAKFLF